MPRYVLTPPVPSEHSSSVGINEKTGRTSEASGAKLLLSGRAVSEAPESSVRLAFGVLRGGERPPGTRIDTTFRGIDWAQHGARVCVAAFRSVTKKISSCREVQRAEEKCKRSEIQRRARAAKSKQSGKD